MKKILIDNTTDLNNFCQRVFDDLTGCDEKFITIDTEFIRERTYWPVVGLIQVASPNEHAVIDPLTSTDFGKFWQLLGDKSILKVLHACNQDLMILYRMAGFVPEPIFDTQIAGMALGLGDFVSYENLVKRYLPEIALNKSIRYTNWLERPLSEQQCKYALEDVTFLREVFGLMKQELLQSNRLSWVEDLMKELSNEKVYRNEPDEVWTRYRGISKRDPEYLAVLKALTSWREKEAQDQDVPKNVILREALLLDIVKMRPRNHFDLQNNRLMSGISPKHVNTILDLINSALSDTSQFAMEEDDTNMDLLKLFLQYKAETNGVAAGLIANNEDLLKLFKGDLTDRLKVNWRYELFTKDALDLLQGKVGLFFAESKIVTR